MRCIPSSTPSSRPLPSPEALGASGAISASSGAPVRMEMTASVPGLGAGPGTWTSGLPPYLSCPPFLPSLGSKALLPVGQEGRWLNTFATFEGHWTSTW